MSVNASLFERHYEPEFFERKCGRCKEPESKCICDEDDRDELPEVDE